MKIQTTKKHHQMDSKMSAPVLTDLLSKQLWEGYLLFAIKVIKLKKLLQGLRWGITPFL